MSEARPSVEFVVDAARRVQQSSAVELRVGDVLTGASWLGQPALDALDAAATGGDARRVARDLAKGTHWILRAAVVATDPWLARVEAFDATPAVLADRAAVFAKLVHTMTNIGFALTSVLDVLRRDRPAGAQLDECHTYLREPATRLSTTMARLAACVVPPRPSLEPANVGAVVERALSRTLPARRPAQVVVGPGMRVACDVEALAETLAAMIEGGVLGAARSLEIDQLDVRGRPHARFAVEGRAHGRLDPSALAATWDLHGGHHLEPQLRLSLGRDVVLAHEGEVFAAASGSDGVRLGLLLPLLVSDC